MSGDNQILLTLVVNLDKTSFKLAIFTFLIRKVVTSFKALSHTDELLKLQKLQYRKDRYCNLMQDILPTIHILHGPAGSGILQYFLPQNILYCNIFSVYQGNG